MIPNIDDDLMSDVVIEEQPTKTYEIKLNKSRMGAYSDGIEAMKQTIYHIINTERYNHLIYSWNYGVELADLFGKPVSYCYAEIKRRITEALLQDDRIMSVNEFEFTHKKGEILTTFRVVTTEGDIRMEKVVNI